MIYLNFSFLSECKIESNLNKLVDIYRSIHRLNEYIENFNDLLNTNLKKYDLINMIFYPPKYSFIKSLLSLSKCGLCITFRILLPRCLSNR